jgi:ABC-type transporter MlaC component
LEALLSASMLAGCIAVIGMIAGPVAVAAPPAAKSGARQSGTNQSGTNQSGTSQATVPAASAAPRADTRSVAAVAKDAVETVVKAAQADPAARNGDVQATAAVVRKDFLPYTDFLRTTRLALGAAWKTATPEQQRQVFEQFQTLLVRVYAVQLTQIHDQKVSFRFDPAVVDAGGNDAVVHGAVKGTGDDLEFGYRLRRSASGWKIYDIDMMGSWLIQVYQQQFTDQMARGGVDGLIKFLAAHNARPG